MYVKFRCVESIIPKQKLFEILKNELKSHWDSISDAPFGAYFNVTEDKGKIEVTMEHCTGNLWSVIYDKNNEELYIEYSGSRLGFYARTPWGNVELIPSFDDDRELLVYVDLAFTGFTVGQVNEKGLIYIERNGRMLVEVATFNVTEYETTTPKEWNVKWYEVIVPLEDDPKYAIIIDPYHGTHPLHIAIRKIVPYKNVYKEDDEHP